MKHSPGESDNLGAYFNAGQNPDDFKKFLQDKVDTYTGMRNHYPDQMDPILPLSTRTLLMVSELVFPMPLERSDILSNDRAKAVKAAVERALIDRGFHDSATEVSSAEIAGLEMIHPHMPALIEILQQMKELGLDEDIYETATGAVFYLGDETEFIIAE